MRIFLDANVLFSAARSDGSVRVLIERLLAAGHECVADAYVVEEARRNLAVKSVPQVVAPTRLLQRLEVAGAHPRIPANAAPLTGYRTHFGRYYGKQLAGMQIHSPRTLAEDLLLAEG